MKGLLGRALVLLSALLLLGTLTTAVSAQGEESMEVVKNTVEAVGNSMVEDGAEEEEIQVTCELLFLGPNDSSFACEVRDGVNLDCAVSFDLPFTTLFFNCV